MGLIEHDLFGEKWQISKWCRTRGTLIFKTRISRELTTQSLSNKKNIRLKLCYYMIKKSYWIKNVQKAVEMWLISGIYAFFGLKLIVFQRFGSISSTYLSTKQIKIALFVITCCITLQKGR